jgi:hypothetical protein
MADETVLTLTLNGHVTLPLLTQAIRGLDELVRAVSKEFGAEDATWLVEDLDDLDIGSAVATMRGQSSRPELLSQAAVAMVSTTELVAKGLGEALNPPAAKAARRLTGVVNGVVPSLSLQTADEIVTVTSGPSRVVERERKVSAFGSLVGVIHTLSQARGLHFRISEETYGRSVAGKFDVQLTDDMRELWGNRATVDGLITRDAQTGWPLAIMDVRRASPAPESKPGAFLRARGIIPYSPDAEPSEVTIRRLRDAS